MHCRNEKNDISRQYNDFIKLKSSLFENIYLPRNRGGLYNAAIFKFHSYMRLIRIKYFRALFATDFTLRMAAGKASAAIVGTGFCAALLFGLSATARQPLAIVNPIITSPLTAIERNRPNKANFPLFYRIGKTAEKSVPNKIADKGSKTVVKVAASSARDRNKEHRAAKTSAPAVVEQENKTPQLDIASNTDVNFHPAKKAKIANVIMNANNALGDEVAYQYAGFIMEAADVYRLDPGLILGVMLTESRGNRSAANKSGAVGLMQVMWRVHKDSIKQHFDNIDDRADMFVAKNNIMVGSWILKGYIERGGSISSGLHSYLGGSSYSYHKKIRKWAMQAGSFGI